MATFKNISDMELTVDGVGVVPAGETCEILDESFNNPNFIPVSGSPEKKQSDKDYPKAKEANDA